MMAASGNGFFKEHWDWLVAGGGVVLLAVSAVMSLDGIQTSADDKVAMRQAALKRMRPEHEGVPPQDFELLKGVSRLGKTPPALMTVDGRKASFLASERRVTCAVEEGSLKKACGRPIPADATACPFCGVAQPTLVKILTDNDNDGLPNDWEKKYGLNPDDPADAALDADGDTFTNAEEYAAKTDPKDKESHPDYLNFVSVDGALRQTYLPFYVREANRIPSADGKMTYRLALPRLGKLGKYEERQFSILVGEPVAIKSGKKKIDTGYRLKSWTPKTEQRKIAGSSMKKTVDVSEAVFERITDKKEVKAVIGVKSIPVDRQAKLVFSRGEKKTFTVVPGDEITIVNRRYTVEAFGKDLKKPTVEVKDVVSGKKREIGALQSGLD